MGSGTGSNLQYLLENQNRFQIKAAFVDRKCGFQEICVDHKIPCFFENGAAYCGKNPGRTSSESREDYCSRSLEFEERILEKLREFEGNTGSRIELILLAGYFRILRGPLLRAFDGHILNVHPGDLRVLGSDKKRLFTGMNAVLKAMVCGLEKTASTVHIVNETIDGGPILKVSDFIPIQLDVRARSFLSEFHKGRLLKPEEITRLVLNSWLGEIQKQYPAEFEHLQSLAEAHQQYQKQFCDWPTYLRTLEEWSLRNPSRNDESFQLDSLEKGAV